MNTLHEKLHDKMMDHGDECMENVSDYIQENKEEFIALLNEHNGIDKFIATLLAIEDNAQNDLSTRHYARVYRWYVEMFYEDLEEEITDALLEA